MLKLKDKRFGKLTVIDYAYSKDKKAYWLCKCDCGSEPVIKSRRNLVEGYTKSCGCLRRALHSEVPYYWIYRVLVKGVNEKRYHDFTGNIMSFDDFLTFTKTDKCHYCGEKIIWSEHTTYKERNINRKYNLDRKDNNIGYTKDNCVVCCSLCNYVKGRHLSYDEMMLLGKCITEIQRRRNEKTQTNSLPSYQSGSLP
jgi:hypothetical protein